MECKSAVEKSLIYRLLRINFVEPEKVEWSAGTTRFQSHTSVLNEMMQEILRTISGDESTRFTTKLDGCGK